MTASVTGLWRYPASSLAGERLGEARLDTTGIEGDRLYGVIDAATGDAARPGTPDRRWSNIAHLGARLAAGCTLEVRVPGGDWLQAPSKRANSAISAFFGFEVRVVPYEGTEVAGYGGPLGAPRYDRAPVHLMTTASLALLRSLHPSGVVDARRFRPNIVIDLPAVEGRFPETEWTGRRLIVGEVELTVTEPCRRCGFTTLSQRGFGEDPEILRTVVRHNAHNLGIYCTVLRPGPPVQVTGCAWTIEGGGAPTPCALRQITPHW